MLNSEMLWQFCRIGLVVALHCAERKLRRNVSLFILSHLLGTFLHELAHYVAAFITGARPSRLSLLPSSHGNRLILGSVTLNRVTAWNAVPTALAPLALACLGVWLFQHWSEFFPHTFISTLGRFSSAYILINNSMPSKEDLQIALNVRSIVLYGGLAGTIGTCYYLLSVR